VLVLLEEEQDSIKVVASKWILVYDMRRLGDSLCSCFPFVFCYNVFYGIPLEKGERNHVGWDYQNEIL
jgi:hypothetical protein